MHYSQRNSVKIQMGHFWWFLNYFYLVFKKYNYFRYTDLSRIRVFPRLPYMIRDQEEVGTGQVRVVMPKFFSTRVCFICHEKPQTLPFQAICSSCMKEPNLIVHTLADCIRKWDSQLLHLDSLCRGCDVAFDSCRNLSCPRMYLRTEAKSEADQIQMAFKILSDF